MLKSLLSNAVKLILANGVVLLTAVLDRRNIYTVTLSENYNSIDDKNWPKRCLHLVGWTEATTVNMKEPNSPPLL